MPRPTLVADIQDTSELKPGHQLGRWVLERVIGHGATAVVWAARHERLGSPVAIKIFSKKNLAFHDVLGEARAAAGIPSPYAIWVYDVDTFSGHHAIVMELCGTAEAVGTSLGLEPDMSPRRAARIVAQAARGVAAAHEGSVFHKDIKPANILIHPVDGRAQITDFGLANPALWRADPRAQRTAETTVSFDDLVESPARAADSHRDIRGPVRVGTPEYMAPEQAEGLRGDMDPRDPSIRPYLVALDVYGLGATLYALLAGKPPFPHGALDTPESTALDVMRQVAEGPPPTLRERKPSVPPRLARIVDRALARDPMQRYHDVHALVRDLEDWLADHPTSLDTSPLQRAGVHLWRERVRAGTAALFTLLVFVSTGLVAMNVRQIRAQQDEISTQQSQLLRLVRQQQDLQRELQLTERELLAARQRIDDQAGALDAASRELQRRGDALTRLTGELDLTSANLDVTTSELDQAAARALDLQRERDTALLELANERQQVEQTLLQLAAAQEDSTKLRGMLIDEAGHSADLERSLAALAAERDALRDSAARAEQRAQALTEEVGQLRRSLADTLAALENRSAELSALRQPPAP